VELTDVNPAAGAGLAGGHGFFLAVDQRAVGRAIQWARSRRLDRVELLAVASAADLARRASLLVTGSGTPSIGVWAVDGTEVEPAEPAPAVEPPPLGPGVWALAGVLSDGGARPVDDHGRLAGEVAGLEVARVVPGDTGPEIDVGVGLADRELGHLVHGGLDIDTRLRWAVSAVTKHRNPTSHHPLTRVARARWLRAMLLDDPSTVGASELEPVPPLRPAETVLADEPSASLGRLRTGRPIVVVTVSGADLDLVPEAADHRQRSNPDAELVVAMAERDLRLNSALLPLVEGLRAIAVPPPWGPR
jgi:hypothetical protein